MLELYSGDEFINTEVKIPPFLVLPMIPTSGVVMFHGTSGIGKSTLSWQLANALEDGQDFLTRKTVKSRVLFICLDMPKYGLWHRWKKSGFKPNFDLAFDTPFDCAAANFRASNRFKKLQEVIQEGGYNLVIVDALAELITKSMNADELPGQVYGIWREIIGEERCVLFIHHDRKRKILDSGNLAEPSKDDALGSSFWINLAQITLHLYKIGDMLRLDHGKSQLGPIFDKPLDLYMAEDGSCLEEWTEHRQKEEVTLLRSAEQTLRAQHPDWESYGIVKKVKLLSEETKKGTATINRWRKAMQIEL